MVYGADCIEARVGWRALVWPQVHFRRDASLPWATTVLGHPRFRAASCAAECAEVVGHNRSLRVGYCNMLHRDRHTVSADDGGASVISSQ